MLFNGVQINGAPFNGKAPTLAQIYTRTATSNAAVIDATIHTALRNRLQADAFDMFDSGAPTRTYQLRYGDTISITDSATASLVTTGTTYTRTATDGILVLDDGHYKSIEAITTDLIALVDSISSTVTGGGVINTRTLSDAMLASDQLQRHLLLTRMLTDGMALADGIMSAALRYRFAADSVAMTDEALDYALRNRFAADAIALSDGTVASRLAFRLTTDGITVTDEVLRHLLRIRTTSDALTLLDLYSATITGSGTVYSSTVSDGLTLNDGVLRWLLQTRVLTDGLAPSDELLLRRLLTRLSSDGVVLVDSATGTVSAAGTINNVTASDAFTITDTQFRWLLRTREASDSVGLADALMRALVRGRVALDTIELNDGIASFLLRTRRVSDALGISDSLIANYLPFIAYTYDVRARLGYAPSGVLLRTDMPQFLGQSATGPVLGGYN